MRADRPPLPAVAIASPYSTGTLTEDDPLRSLLHAARLFNLEAFFASRGWQSRTDLTSTEGIDQLLLVGREACSAGELAQRARAKLAKFEGFGYVTLDWSDIDAQSAGSSDVAESLAELVGPWPPPDWEEITTRDVTGPIAIAKAVGEVAVAASAASFELLDEPRESDTLSGRVASAVADVATDSRPLLVFAGDPRPHRVHEGGVASADGEWRASLDGSELILHDVRRTRPLRFTGWTSDRGLDSPVRLLSVGRTHGHVIDLIVATPGGTFVLSTGDRQTWTAPERLGDAARGAAQIGKARLAIDEDGRVVDLGASSFKGLDSEVTAIGMDAAEVGHSAWLVIWGEGRSGGPEAEVHRWSGTQRRWERLATIDDVVRSGLERPARAVLPHPGVALWMTRSDGSVERSEIGQP